MSSFFSKFFSDRNAFWLGFIVGALSLWLISNARIYLPAIIRLLKRTFVSIREYFSTGTDQRFRSDIIRFAQHQHLASPMFSLDEIIIEPTLMVRPVQVSFDNQTLPIDTVNLTIPYIPDWPELGATYQTPRIGILTALQNGANIALVGNPGSGKTVALAYLVSQIASRSPLAGKLHNHLPIYIHTVDLNYTPSAQQPSSQDLAAKETSAQDSLEVKRNLIIAAIVEAISRHMSTITLPRLPKLIQSTLDENKAILLIDGIDELPQDRLQPILAFIKDFTEQYPKNQCIVAVSFENTATLPSLGFQVLAMAAWGDREKIDFVHKWDQLWKLTTNKTDQESENLIDHHCLVSWLTTGNLPSTPFDMTLKVWAAYSGDLLGSDAPSTIEAHVRRIASPHSKSRDVLERLALQMVVNMNPAIQPHQSDTIPISYGSDQENVTAERESESLPEPQKVKLHQLPGELINAGLLYTHSDSRFRFSNPIFTGYLAAKALVSYSGLNRVIEQPSWSGKSMTLFHYSQFGDASTIAQYLLRHDDFLRREQLGIARWLRVAPKNQPWRSLILRTLVAALQTDRDTLPLAARLVTSLAASGDPGVMLLFRQMLQSENANLRQLAALACGITKDPKAIDDLAKLMKEKSPSIVRSASLALIAIGDKRALETVADSLVHGSELMRRAAAEAFANHPEEGHPALQEGSTHDDLKVRHAVVYGLMRIQQSWAVKIIERMQVEDKEWIVRNAAIQAIEEMNQPGLNIPRQLPDLSETPWLADYAAKQGMGVAPGKPAYNLVVDALKKGSTEEKLQALNYLSMKCENDSLPVIYSWYFGGTGEIRDAAYQTLWYLAISQVPLPSPHQYGFN